MGTTPAGGLFGTGTVYKLDVSTSPPTVVVLRSFESCCPSSFGSGPIPDLVKGAGGWVYGMTWFGGPTDFGGTIFGITPNGTIKLLHQFGFSEGSGPIGMTIADDGSFYGTTRYGGLNWGGILFRLRVDADGDGVRDPVDNCPTAANPAQIDTDGDGIGDGCPPEGPQAHVAKLTLGTLQFTYDGTPKATTVTATPIEALQTGVLTVTYNGSTTPPTNAGLYTVVASLVNPNYSTADVSAFMVIQQAPSIVTWNTPAHIFNPTPLSATQLNATANVPGTFVYMPDIGTVLPIGNNQQLTVAFTPNDSVNYTSAQASVTIDVRGFTVVDTTPPVVTAPGDISVLATQATGADGNAVYYPYIGTPLPTLAGFLAAATATDDLSQPVQLPTELRSCQTNALVDPDVDAATVFPLGTNVNCVFFRFRDGGGNIGSAMALVHVYPGTVAPAGSSQPVPALGPTGLPTGVSLEFEGGVTVAGMSVRPVRETRPPRPAPTSSLMWTRRSSSAERCRTEHQGPAELPLVYFWLVLHHRVRHLDHGAVPGAHQSVLPACLRERHALALQRGDRTVGRHHYPARHGESEDLRLGLFSLAVCRQRCAGAPAPVESHRRSGERVGQRCQPTQRRLSTRKTATSL